MDQLFVAPHPVPRSRTSVAVSAGIHVAAVVAIAAGGLRVTSSSPPPRQSITFIALSAAGGAPLWLPQVTSQIDSVEPSSSSPADSPPETPPARPQPAPEQSVAEPLLSEPPDAPTAPVVAPAPVVPEEIPIATATRDHVDPVVGAFDRVIAVRPRTAPAVVRVSGFETPPVRASRVSADDVAQPAGFDRAPAPRRALPMAQPVAAVIDTPVEVLFKPAADYTTEARALRIEGEVVLEVTFGASSDISVIRVVRSLGHGLDEAAARAVRGIQFRPAKTGGVPVDVSTLVHIEFQLS